MNQQIPPIVKYFWTIMFGEDFKVPVDVNSPENHIYVKFQKDQDSKALKTFMDMGGKKLMSDLAEKVKLRMYDLAHMVINTEQQQKEALSILKQYQLECLFLITIMSKIRDEEEL